MAGSKPVNYTSTLSLFSGNHHKPFLLEGGNPAALLVHGFMGTPAEMRPLATKFHQAGYTVQGILLPGFGHQIESLFERRFHEWIDEVESTLNDLKRKHHPTVLVGYSLGAAVALNTAASTSPSKLVLLAPFLRLGRLYHLAIWQVLKRLFPRPQPFRRADFSDARIEHFVGGLLPDLDLKDPQVQEFLRQLTVPARFVDQIIGVGRSAEKAAANIHTPTLIIQGKNDQAVKAKQTRQFISSLPGPFTYDELEADHGLVEEHNPGFEQTAQSVLTFAGRSQ